MFFGKSLLIPNNFRNFAPALSKANPCDGELRHIFINNLI